MKKDSFRVQNRAQLINKIHAMNFTTIPELNCRYVFMRLCIQITQIKPNDSSFSESIEKIENKSGPGRLIELFVPVQQKIKNWPKLNDVTISRDNVPIK